MVGYGPMCFLTNWVAGFFNQQNHWKEPIDTFDFVLRDIYQGKPWEVTSKTATFSSVWVVVPLVQSDFKILWATISFKGINWQS